MNRTGVVQPTPALKERRCVTTDSFAMPTSEGKGHLPCCPAVFKDQTAKRRRAETVLDAREESPSRTTGAFMEMQFQIHRNTENADRNPQVNGVRFYRRFARRGFLAVDRFNEIAGVCTGDQLLRSPVLYDKGYRNGNL